MSWLDSINRDREQNGAARLEHCILSAHGDVFRVPWEDVVYPQFNKQPQMALKEKKELTATNKQDLNFSRQEVKLLPFHTDQSAEGSRDEESEGEYVELMEFPRFSPQKGSLTQSISLQYRARTTAHANTQNHETEKHTNTHTHEADENTNTHTCLRSSPPFAALTHTLTHCDSNTLSSCSSVDVSSHTLTSRLIEEDFSEHPCRSISPSLVSSAAPDAKEQIEGTNPVTEVSPYQQQRGDEEGKEEMGQKERIQEEEKELRKKTNVVVVPVRVEKRIKRRQRRLEERKYVSKEEVDENKVEGNGDEFEKAGLGEEVGVQNIQQCQEKGEEVIKREKKEEEGLGGGEKEGVKRDSYFENKQTHTENSHCENNILHFEGSYCGHIRQPHPTDFFCGNIPETHSRNSYSENNVLQSYFEDTYFENIKLKTHLKDFCYTNSREETHSEDSCCGNIRLVENPEELRCVKDKLLSCSQNKCSDNVTEQNHLTDYCGIFSLRTCSKDTYSERTLQTYPENSYSESTLQIHAEDSCSENIFRSCPKDSYYDSTSQIHAENSYFENTSLACIRNSYSESALLTDPNDSYSESTLQIHVGDTCSENTLQPCPIDFYSENKLQIHAGDSCSENTLQKDLGDSYFEKPLQTLTKDSYPVNSPSTQPKTSHSENILQTHAVDSYFESTLEIDADSYSENTLQIHAGDSCSEDTFQTHTESSYSENLQQTEPKNSCSKNELQTHAEVSCSKNTQQTDSRDSYSESILQKDSKDSYFERALQTHAENSYSDNTPQTHPKDPISDVLQANTVDPEDFYCESTYQTQPKDYTSENSLEKHTEDLCSENTLQSSPKDSYSESTLEKHAGETCSENISQTQPKDSYSESTLQTDYNDSYFDNALQIHAKDSCSEKTLQTCPRDSCSESTLKTEPHDSKSENTLQTCAEGSCAENTLQTDPKDCYFERTLQIHAEESFSDNTPQSCSKDTYSESTSQICALDACSENTLQTQPKDSYSGSTMMTNPNDSYSESALKTEPIDSKSENTLQTDAEVSCSESTFQKDPKDSYFDNALQIHAKDSCSEKTLQTCPKDSDSESTLKTEPYDTKSENILQTFAEVSCSESTFQKDPKDSYFERTLQSHAEDSFSDITLQSCPKESYSEHLLQAHDDDSYSESSLQKEPNNSYFERTLQTYAEDSYSDINLDTQPKGLYSESKLQTGPKDDYFESALQSQLEESYCENETLQRHADSVKFHGEQQNLEETTEEVDQEHSSEGFCGPRSSDHHTEGSSPVLSDASVSAGPSPEESGKIVAPPTFPSKPSQFSKPSQCPQSPQSSFYSQLLRSGAVCLPGTRDRGGRLLLTVFCSHSVWWNPNCDSTMLLRLLLYYTSTIRAEVRALGLTVLADARSAAPSSDLFSALESLQEATPGSVYSVLILANKDSSLHLDKPASTQVEVLCSLKTLRKHVDLQQLPTEFGGFFTFRQSSWITFTLRLQLLSRQCCDVINLLQKAVSTLQNASLPASAQDAELLLSRYKVVMNSVLGDVRLVQLQQEGGASLSWLRREEGGVSEEQRTALEEVSTLYNQVDELLHRLVTLSNARTQELNFILDFRNMEKGFNQVRTWLEEIGEVHLKVLREPADSLELLKKKQQDFKDFYTSAYDHCKRGEGLLAQVEHWGDLSSADLQVYEDKVHSFWAQLQDFSQRVKSTGQNIERAIQLFHFLDQAYNWALEGRRHLAGISMEDCMLPDKCQAVIGCLQEYQVKHPAISESRFQEMKSEAGELRGERGLRQWSFTWSTCQDTKNMFDQRMDAALQTRDSAHRQRSSSVVSRSSISSRKSLSGLWGSRFNSSPTEDEIRTSSIVSSTSLSQNPPLLRRLFRSSSSESSERLDVCSTKPSPTSSQNVNLTPSVSHSKRQQLKKTQSLDCPSTPNVLRYGGYPHTKNEPPRQGNTGVFIRGLEVSSTEAADRTLCPRTPAQGWRGRGQQSPQTPGTPKINIHRPQGSKLLHIVEEMVTTERDYVSSLRYIIRHYFPEMDQADLPQDLRGQRSVIFGNLEKLLDFHSQFFLRELEACWKHPLRVPHCFLRHREQFALYSLYSKNKPRSDALLANHGHTFFRRKQLELGDKMDLSSYLLKPIQRMSKYALLLTDLMKEVGMAQEAELTALQTATDMVKFQLRHGNDLLAMDAIRDCDVNLKEQGQLIRQDEFTVWTGRRKSQRHVFLFEEMVLFSKPKKMEGGLDVFIYKHSFKTADVGLTESSGNGGLRFEIWFRRRTSKNQNFILQASSADVKHAWTSDITRILWTQATRNKEVRLKELVSMGVGNKPFLDIQPSDAAISDRAVHYITKSRGARTRASIAVSALDNSDPFKRGVMTSDLTASGPSSCSLLGPLNLHMYSQSLPDAAPADASFSSSCIEEDEQEHETSSQPSITTESSGSSSRCFSGSTDSDSGCVSTHVQEVLPGESSPTSQPSSSSSSSSSHNKQNLSSKHIYAGGADQRPT